MSAVVSLALATAAFVGTHLLLSHPLRRAAGRAARRARLCRPLFAGRVRDPRLDDPRSGARARRAAVGRAALVVAGRFGADAGRQHPAGRLAGRQSGLSEHRRRAPRAIPPPRGVFAITRHPMNSSFMLWALVHISLSGSARNLIVAGGILVLALVGSIGQDRKKRAAARPGLAGLGGADLVRAVRRALSAGTGAVARRVSGAGSR